MGDEEYDRIMNDEGPYQTVEEETDEEMPEGELLTDRKVLQYPAWNCPSPPNLDDEDDDDDDDNDDSKYDDDMAATFAIDPERSTCGNKKEVVRGSRSHKTRRYATPAYSDDDAAR